MKAWSELDEADVECQCGVVFRSKGQFEAGVGGRGILSQKGCPTCTRTAGHRKLTHEKKVLKCPACGSSDVKCVKCGACEMCDDLLECKV